MDQKSESHEPETILAKQDTDIQQTKLFYLNLPLIGVNLDKKVESIKLQLHCKDSEKLFYIIHRAYITERHNQRKGTANTLTRSEVRGGGRKPWRQKGTGRARAGSNRSPLWRGGGVSFGPKAKLYFNKINRKEWRLALRSLLIKKSKNIIVLDNFEHAFKENKTSTLKVYFEKLDINIQQKLVIIFNPYESSTNNLYRITNNIKTIKVLAANQLNITDLINADKLLIIKNSLNLIKKTYDK